MPGPDAVLSQGQTNALLLLTAGSTLLVILLAWEALSRLETVRTRTRSAVVNALLLAASLALLLVRRLDPAALSQVMANVTAALLAASRDPSQWKDLR